MSEKIQQELLDKSSKFLAQASHTLGQTVEHVYGILVRQQIISGIGELIQTGLWIIVVVTINVIYWKWVRSRWGKWDESDNFDAKMASCIAGGFAMVIITLGMLAVVSNISDGIQHILNPEYYAIQFIFNAATGQSN